MPLKTLKNILVTRSLSEEQLEYARRLGLNPLVAPALRVEFPRNWDKVMRKLDQHPGALWVFTSRNAVEALGKIQKSEFRIQSFPEVYAVGRKTAEALQELSIEAVYPEQQDAVGLAKLIKDRYNQGHYNKTESLPSKSTGSTFPHTGQSSNPVILHWCGNRRRDELGRELKEAGFEYIDLEVYQTELNTIPLPDEKPDGILFFSPSAVEAFRQSNGFKGSLPELFAIGNTTGESLSLESGKYVHIPAEPSTEKLLKLVAEILQTNVSIKVPLRRGNKGDDKPNIIRANLKENRNNLYYNKSLKNLARKLRNESTQAEIRLWTETLRAGKLLGYTFLRQRPVLNYIADFMCKELKLIIELDGYTHSFEQQWKRDLNRQKELEDAGFTILRFHDEEIMNDLKNVERVIELWIVDQNKNEKSPPSKGE